MKTTAAFYLDDPLNGMAANMYGRDNVTSFMRDGAIRAKDWETMYTMGMRGDGNRESPKLTAPQLEDIIQVQQDMLQNVTEKRLEDLPQIWALYKELGQYWQAGMNVSELITMMWTDDNFGNLLRVPLTNETDRLGGAGVYYHFGYVEKPWHYIWINTIQLVKTWEQMHIAYEKGARQIWICNSQDLKPYEVPTNHFLDMAYDMSRFTTPDSTTEWLKRWSAREFGGGIASDVAKIYNDYGRMVIRRKYEMLSISPFTFSVFSYDEALNVQQEWQDLLALTQSARDPLNDAAKDTFFELVLAPVMTGKNVIDLYINTALGKPYQSQRRTSTNTLASKARANFGNDAAIIIRYNQLFNNKWAWITSHTHIGFPGLDEPKSNIMPTLAYVDDTMIHDLGIMGVAVQGSNISVHEGGTITLRSMDPYLPPSEKRWIDVFTRANGTFSYQIRPNVSFVSSTNPSGQLTSPGNNSDIRSHISVDWAKAPKGHSWVALNIFRTDNDTDLVTTALLPINKYSVPPTFRGFVESNGAISIEPAHWTKSDRKNGVSYIEVPHYGRTLSGVKLWPVTASSQTPLTGPKLTYNFYALSSTPEAKLIIFLGGSLNYDPTRPLKLAYSVDSGPVTTKQVLPDYVAGALPAGWDSSVINGGWSTTSTLSVQEGAHTLNLWLLEPGVVLQKIILNFGGLKHSLLGPPESKLIHV